MNLTVLNEFGISLIDFRLFNVLRDTEDSNSLFKSLSVFFTDNLFKIQGHGSITLVLDGSAETFNRLTVLLVLSLNEQRFGSLATNQQFLSFVLDLFGVLSKEMASLQPSEGLPIEILLQNWQDLLIIIQINNLIFFLSFALV